MWTTNSTVHANIWVMIPQQCGGSILIRIEDILYIRDVYTKESVSKFDHSEIRLKSSISELCVVNSTLDTKKLYDLFNESNVDVCE